MLHQREERAEINLCDEDIKTLVVNGLSQTLREELIPKKCYENDVHPYPEAFVGVRRGYWDDEGTTTIVIVDSESGKYARLVINDEEWFDLKRAKKEAKEEEMHFMDMLELALREVVFPRINKETDWAIGAAD